MTIFFEMTGLLILLGVWAAIIVALIVWGMDAWEWSETKLRGTILLLSAFLVLTVPIAMLVQADANSKAVPFDGYVYKKEFYPAHTQVVMTGKASVVQQVPERYNFVLKNAAGEQRSCDVDHETYDAIPMGGEFRCGGY